MLGRRRMLAFLCGVVGAAGATLVAPMMTVASAACVGDCDGSGEVTVDEIITMVNIALSNAPLSACPAGDADGSGEITIDEIIIAVNNALGMCPASGPTPTATAAPSPTPTTHKVTVGPGFSFNPS